MLSIIVPALDEAQNLRRLLPALRAGCPGAEVVVVDGGSADDTARVMRDWPDVRHLLHERGRARQMNAGARAARGDLLLFLHADTALPDDAGGAIARVMADPAVVGGRFDVAFSNPRWPFRMIAAFMNGRSRLSGIATGDQAIFVRRDVLDRLGGYPDIPLMEDVALCVRLRREGRLACLRLRVVTSARKWERDGILRTIGLMWTLRFLYRVGVDPARLHRWYYGRQPVAGSPGGRHLPRGSGRS
jgi:rSAM/selenodomain-associated transferase 2